MLLVTENLLRRAHFDNVFISLILLLLLRILRSPEYTYNNDVIVSLRHKERVRTFIHKNLYLARCHKFNFGVTFADRKAPYRRLINENNIIIRPMVILMSNN